MRQFAAHGARWGLFVTTLVMALALVATGLSSYIGAREAARELLGARALDFAVLVRHSLRLAEQRDTALSELIEETRARGLRGVAVTTVQGPAWVAVGIDESSAIRAASGCRASPLRRGWMESDGVLLVAQPLRPGRGLGPGHRRGFLHKGYWRRDEPPPGNACLVLALDAHATASVASRAGATLLLSSVAAALLLAVALVFWRASRHAERLGAELARDRQLKMLGEMSAVLGHELRNPLASLKGHAQLLCEKIASDHTAHADAQWVVREIKRLEGLTSEVLEYARTAELRVAPADPGELARASAESLADFHIDVVLESPPASYPLDAHRMQQVLENLLRNAVGVSASGATLRVSSEGGCLQFEVRDRGPGIAPGQEERIFEPFVTDRVRGTGLGLALAKRIVEGHGGTITAGNDPEGGAVFRVVLPAPSASTERSSGAL
jgi:two-component system sensor histidine kinase HydH